MSAELVTYALLGGAGYVAYKKGLIDDFFGTNGAGTLPPGEAQQNSAIARLKDRSLANAYASGTFKDDAFQLSSAPRVTTTKPLGDNTAGAGQTPATTEGKPSTAQQQIQAAAEEKLKQEYEKLSCEAKKKGAAQLNESLGYAAVSPDQACELGYAELSAAIGAGAAIAGCAAIGVGAAVAPLCGIVGAYLGKEVGAWVEKDLIPWMEENWADAALDVASMGATKVYDLFDDWV